MYYNIGEVSRFLGVSRDTIKFYEEKGLVSPKKDEENGYRKYSMSDIHNLLLVNFYRDIDIEIKTLQNLKITEEFGAMDKILNEHEKKLKEEIAARKVSLKKIKEMKDNFKKIKQNLDKFTIRPMERFEVLEELKDYNLDNPDEIFELNIKARENLGLNNKPNNLGNMIKEINFSDEELLNEKHLIVRKLGANEKSNTRNILEYKKCGYTIVKIKAIDSKEEGKAEMIKQYTSSLKNVAEANERHIGKAFFKMSLSSYENDIATMYLEIFIPLQ